MKKNRIILALLFFTMIILSLSMILQAEEVLPAATGWPMFRHDPLHTGLAGSGAPITGSVLWQTQIGLPITSSPAVVNKKMFFGIRDQVLALDSRTGATLWKAPMVGEIYSSPAVDPLALKTGLVYIASYGSKSSTLSALEMNTGAVCWWTWMSTKSSPTVVTNPSVIINNSIYPNAPRATVYIGNGTNLLALDADTGKILWTFEAYGQIDSTPAVDDRNVYFGTNTNMVFAINRYTGSGVWKFEAKGPVVSSPAVGILGVVFGAGDGSVYCLDKKSGAIQWTYGTGGAITSSPAYANGNIYIGSNTGLLYKFSEDGKLIWYAPTAGVINSSPAVAAGKVYIGSYGSRSSAIFCFDDLTGKQLWFKWMMMDSSPVIADGLLFVTNSHGYAYAFTDWEVSNQ